MFKNHFFCPSGDRDLKHEDSMPYCQLGGFRRPCKKKKNKMPSKCRVAPGWSSSANLEGMDTRMTALAFPTLRPLLFTYSPIIPFLLYDISSPFTSVPKNLVTGQLLEFCLGRNSGANVTFFPRSLFCLSPGIIWSYSMRNLFLLG